MRYNRNLSPPDLSEMGNLTGSVACRRMGHHKLHVIDKA